MPKPETLSRRERQTMDVIYELGEATAREVRKRLPDPPSDSAVRAVLSRLVELGELKYRAQGPRYLYSATASKQKLRQAALRKIVDTFFEGSPLDTINALLGISASELTQEELDELEQLVARAREKTRGP